MQRGMGENRRDDMAVDGVLKEREPIERVSAGFESVFEEIHSL